MFISKLLQRNEPGFLNNLLAGRRHDEVCKGLGVTIRSTVGEEVQFAGKRPFLGLGGFSRSDLAAERQRLGLLVEVADARYNQWRSRS